MPCAGRHNRLYMGEPQSRVGRDRKLERTTVPAAGGGALQVLRKVASSYLFRRLIKALVTIFVMATLTFFLIRLMPGGPVEAYISNLVTQYNVSHESAEQQAASLFSLDLEAPVYQQYLEYLANLVRGDLGESLVSRGVPVSQIVLTYLPWTLFSVGTALIISFTVGVLLGMVMAYKRESTLDHVLTNLGSILSAIPDYITGILILVWVGVQWELIDVTAMRGTLSPGIQPGFNLTFIGDALYHAALPITTYVLGTIGLWMLTMRGSTESTLGEDYVTVAKVRGLKERRIATAYVGRNAALPPFTQLTISIALVFGGALIIEWLFVYEGLGYVLYNSIQQRDYPVMQGVFLIITTMVIVANLLADLFYSRLDPRIRVGGRE
jgi:peptide/nickel transport system permease protein